MNKSLKINSLKSIAIFSGSFNPVHQGHINVAKCCIDNMNVDQLWFSIIKNSPFKKHTFYDCSLYHREVMLKHEINNNKKYPFFLDNWEIKNQFKTTYSIDYARYLIKKYLNIEFFFLIGDDQLSKLHLWKDIYNLSKLVKIIVFCRKSRSFDKEEIYNLEHYCYKFLDNPLFPGKSKDIIKGINMFHLSKYNLNYINTYSLYYYSHLNANLSKFRMIHSLNVVRSACSLAYKNNIDLRKTFMAAIYHDICKEWDKNKIKVFIKKYNLTKEYKNIKKYQSHSYLACKYLEKVLKIDDLEVFSAINCHTIPKKEMSKLDKIIFIADKLCKDRKFEEKETLWAEVNDDLDHGFEQIIFFYKKYLIAKKIKITNDVREIMNFYIKKD